MTDPAPLIAARRARAQASRARAEDALRIMIRRREPITFSAVAARAGVSREYLYRCPELAEKIRAGRTPVPIAVVLARSDAGQPVVAALRDHIRRLEAQHADAARTLRAENEQLRRQLEAVLGQVLGLTESRPSPPTM